MKYIINVLIGLLTVLSSCLGAKLATENALRSPENQIRIAKVNAIKNRLTLMQDSITNAHPEPKIDARDTTLYVKCEDTFMRRYTYSQLIEWERIETTPPRIAIYATKNKNPYYIASIIGKNCSISRVPM